MGNRKAIEQAVWLDPELLALFTGPLLPAKFDNIEYNLNAAVQEKLTNEGKDLIQDLESLEI